MWSWDSISDRTDNGGKRRILSVIDEYSRECLALQVARQLTAGDLIEIMKKLVTQRGAPAHVRSDNGSGVRRPPPAKLAGRAPRPRRSTSNQPVPGRTGTSESCHGSLRDECLDRELMLSVAEAHVVIEDYRRYYNEVRPHGGIGYRTPAQACREAQALETDPTSVLHQKLDPNPETDTCTT